VRMLEVALISADRDVGNSLEAYQSMIRLEILQGMVMHVCKFVQTFHIVHFRVRLGLPKFGSAQFFNIFEESRTELKGPPPNRT
jgi:hypothetical protein